MAIEPNSMAQVPSFLAAAYDAGFALFHLLFWRLFGWPARLTPSGSINQSITQTLNLMLVYVFAVYAGVISWMAAGRETATGMLLAGAGFWFLRAIVQPALFHLSARATIAMTLLFVAGGLLHGWAAVS